MTRRALHCFTTGISTCIAYLLVILATCQARSLHEGLEGRQRRDAASTLGNGADGGRWTPGGQQTLADYLKCHGMPPTDCSEQKQKLQHFEQMMDRLYRAPPPPPPPKSPVGMLAQDAPPVPNPDASLNGCMLLTKQQLSDIIARMEAYYESMINNSTGTSGGKRRKKRGLINFRNSPTSKWTFPIYYKFDGAHSSDQQQIIRNAFQHWMDNTCATFIEAPLNQDIKDNHLIMTAANSGCYSYVGKVPYIPQQINLYSSCLSRFGTPVHEIGHSLGLWHTQMRTDRDQWIQILWENIIPGYASQFYNYIDMDAQGVPYDLNSVMHYSALDGVSINGKYTMLANEPFYQRNMGQRTGLSYSDIKMINRAYCSNICTSPTSSPCQHGGYQNPKSCDRCLCPDGFAGNFCESVAPSENAQCGGEVYLTNNARSTVILSPGYDTLLYYNSHMSCNWWIKAPVGQRIQLTFDGEFALYCEYESCYHWVEVKYKSDLGLQGGRFCCYDKPNVTVTSESNEMMLVFRSNFTVEYYRAQRGFKANIQIVSANTTFATSRDSNPPATSSPPTTTTTTTTTTPTPTTTTTPSTTTNSVRQQNSPLFYCSFEIGTPDPLCGMIQDTTDQFDWTVFTGPTPSDPTGPDYAIDLKYYIYIEASAPRIPNDEARLLFPALQYSGNICVDFFYHMFGFHINAIELIQIDGSTRTIVWSRYGDKGNIWYRGFADISYRQGQTLMFIGRRGNEYSGDAALDKIQITTGKCL